MSVAAVLNLTEKYSYECTIVTKLIPEIPENSEILFRAFILICLTYDILCPLCAVKYWQTLHAAQFIGRRAQSILARTP